MYLFRIKVWEKVPVSVMASSYYVIIGWIVLKQTDFQSLRQKTLDGDQMILSQETLF